MTTQGTGRMAIERPGNPLVEAVGPAPLAIFAVIAMPGVEIWHSNPEVAGEMARAALELARDYRVKSGQCECCGRSTSEIVVGESGTGPAATRRRWAVCRDCIRLYGGRSLRTKLSYIDHTQRKFPGPVANIPKP